MHYNHTLDHDREPRRSRARLATVAALFFLALAIFTSPLVASAAPRMEVKVIEAKSSGPASVDAPLKRMSSKLKRSFKSFKSFKLVKTQTFEASKGDYTLSIPPGLKAKLKLSTSAKGVKLMTKVKRKKGITKARYGELFFQAFRQKGKALILAVIVRK